MFPGAEVDTTVLMNLTVAEVARRYGGMKGFKEALAAQKIQSDTQYRDLQVAEKRGELIPRELVKQHMFGYLERANLRLLRDFPKTATRKIWSMVEAEQSPEEAEKEIRSMISEELDSAARSIKRTIKKDTRNEEPA